MSHDSHLVFRRGEGNVSGATLGICPSVDRPTRALVRGAEGSPWSSFEELTG